MPLLLVLLLVVFLWMVLTYRARQRVRDCRWRENRGLDTPEGRYFVCMNCGAETFSADNMPPRLCLKGVPDPR
ncbi:MAG: hypothetical protein KDA50_08290 [Rhodobacteraceae bacterium]|nr:hypothetical protein [Paracoccaceae bacterium]